MSNEVENNNKESKLRTKTKIARKKIQEGTTHKVASKGYDFKEKFMDAFSKDSEVHYDNAVNEAMKDRSHNELENDLLTKGTMNKQDIDDYINIKNKTINNTNENLKSNTVKVKKDESDAYVKTLNKILDNLEEIYGLNSTIKGVPLSHMNIRDVNKYLLDKPKHENKELNGKAGKYIVELSYLGDRLEFFGYDKVDFGKYKFLESTLAILKSFSTSNNIRLLGKPNDPRHFSKLLAVLQGVESDNPKFKTAVGYRLLRLFTILVYNNNIIDAGIVAKFILMQMALAYAYGAKVSNVQSVHNNNYVHKKTVNRKDNFEFNNSSNRYRNQHVVRGQRKYT